MLDPESKTRVLILTPHYRITGEIALVPGARLTDYMTDAKSFLAVAEAVVSDRDGHQIFSTPFLNVSRDHVEIIVPLELVSVE